jgi:hypothetical protein
MSDLILITISTREPSNPESGFMATYLAQLAAAGIETHVEMIREFDNMQGGGTLGGKVAMLRKLTLQFQHYGKLVFSDAFDVQFFGAKEDVIAKIPTDSVLMAAEKNCYPEPHLWGAIEKPTLWAFVNGGLLCGTPASFIAWLEAIEQHPEYDPNMLDQSWFNRRLAEKSPIVKVDSPTNLFYCLFGEIEELCFRNGLPYNTVTGNSPNFLHSNGGSSRADIWERTC